MPRKFRTYVRAIKDKDRDFHHYLLSVLLRIILVFMPQTGYIHPDEFFQTVEPMAGDEFQLDVVRTWEFNKTLPIRSVALPLLYIRLPLNIWSLLSRYMWWLFEVDLKTSYWLLVAPRIVMLAISFINDYSLNKICQTYSLKRDTRLFALGSSYVILVYATHTFSNAIEMAIFSLLIYLVSDCMIHSNTVIYKKEFLEKKYNEAKTVVEKVKYFKMKMRLPEHSFNRCFVISTLCVAGCFNRPTFLLFGFPVIFQWLHRGMGTKSVGFLDFNLRIFYFIIMSIPALLLCIVVDSMYYKYLTISEIEHGDVSINNFVVTPLNFLRYNLNPNNTAQHGEHPKWVHVLVNMPLLFNVLGVATVVTFSYQFYRFSKEQYQQLPRAQSIVGLLSSAIVVPVIGLSFINHQEPRFIIPVLISVILLHAPKLRDGFINFYPFTREYWLYRWFYNNVLVARVSSKYLMKVWIGVNVAFTFFYGFLHQGGVFPLTDHFAKEFMTKATSTQLHIVTSHIYSVPTYLMYLPSTSVLYRNHDTGHKYRKSKSLFLHEYGSQDIEMLIKKVKLLLDINEAKAAKNQHTYRLYLALPTSKVPELDYALYKFNSTFVRYRRIKTFYPHLSLEAFPDFFAPIHPAESGENSSSSWSIPTNFFKQIFSFIKQFGLALYRVEINKT